MRWCKKCGIKIVTVFGFSTENWNRDPQEVTYLMTMFEEMLGSEASIKQFMDEGVRVRVIGERERLSPRLQKVITNIEEMTKENALFFLNLAVSYGGRWDITQAVQSIVREGIEADRVTEDMISERLSMAGVPEPDLVIRAGGEMRFSNFLLWQSAYAELFFSSKLWPDFGEEDLAAALEEFARRQRRFGH